MDKTEKLAVLEATLERAAEQLGDITPMVMDLFYQRFPEARASFKTLGLDEPEQLEATMVENALFFIMDWWRDDAMIAITLEHSVPHHKSTLAVPPAYYTGLITATADVIGSTIPAGAEGERTVLDEIHARLAQVIAESTEYT